MIYYFSGTGNSKWVAQKLGELTQDETADILSLSLPPDITGKRIGLVFPVYAWGIPEPVVKFIRSLTGKAGFSYGVCTCGADAGNTMEKLRKLFPVDSVYSVVMPNNYVFGSDPDTGEAAVDKVLKAEKKLETISQQIQNKQPVSDVIKGGHPFLKSNLVHFGFSHFACSTKPFWVTEKCIGCGKCAANCPAKVIVMKQGKPKWSGNCFQCTRCMNGCPVEAIQYGKGSEKRKRYHFPDLQHKS